ncbi:54S ribosomal protein L8-like protein [Hapsidospora chrysogenum ATCC 11550]|uniref:54S ribosomal protein L8-like protein n=1 Tax=Hapsidospora chrysogenum (strain ATCC 11550 / CBS 779.69 / DSM 880 / IAM 14645 / JCM 23072 / IMI 49137) TaxID=857340 RepID=A0A086STS4_HAPC1|nr:54S ribosomal protein L8-like protein [Hapsidospora chrysogenum ATCC 11550]
MAGGLVKYRHLSRDSAARQALLRGLVTQLVHHEHIVTTHAKAKEAQRLAEKLVTLAKKDNETSRRSVQGILYEPQQYMPKVFGELRKRYETRKGGYTRVTRTEPRDKHDQAETSILEFVDGPKDTKFMMTAKTVARDRLLGRTATPVTVMNVKKVTAYRGEREFEEMVQRFMLLSQEDAGPPLDGGQQGSNGRPHWEPKVANFKMPKGKGAPGQSAVNYLARVQEGSVHETEASELADIERKRIESLAADIVPDSHKRGGEDAKQ